MARRSTEVKIEDKDSRDFGKTFIVTEMDADAAEWWAFRVLQAILGGDNGDDLKLVDFRAPLSELAPIAIKMGLKAIAGLPMEKAKPILDDMMGCVSVKIPDGTARKLMANDVEDIPTRLKLRGAMLELHTGFFAIGSGSTSG
jgi:hypothetical protein